MKNYWAARVLFSRSNFCSHVKNVSQSIGAEIRFFFVELSYSETLFPKILENAALNSMRRPWKPSFKAISRSWARSKKNIHQVIERDVNESTEWNLIVFKWVLSFVWKP